MDMNQLNALDDPDKERYLMFARLFSDPGWAALVEFYRHKAEAMMVNGASAGSWEENRVALGMRLAYEEFANLENSNEMEFAEKADTQLDATSAEYEEIYE